MGAKDNKQDFTIFDLSLKVGITIIYPLQKSFKSMVNYRPNLDKIKIKELIIYLLLIFKEQK